MKEAMDAVRRPQTDLRYLWGSETANPKFQFIKEFIMANSRPEKLFLDMTTRNHKEELPHGERLHYYIAGFVCKDNSRRNSTKRSPVLEEGGTGLLYNCSCCVFGLLLSRKGRVGESMNTLAACTDTIHARALESECLGLRSNCVTKVAEPDVWVLENVQGCPCEPVVDYLTKQLNTPRKDNPDAQWRIAVFECTALDLIPCSRTRRFFVGIRADQWVVDIGWSDWKLWGKHVLGSKHLLEKVVEAAAVM